MEYLIIVLVLICIFVFGYKYGRVIKRADLDLMQQTADNAWRMAVETRDKIELLETHLDIEVKSTAPHYEKRKK